MQLKHLVLFIMLAGSLINAQEEINEVKFDPSFTIGGRLQFDFGNFDYDGRADDSYSSGDVRRAMLESSGLVSVVDLL